MRDSSRLHAYAAHDVRDRARFLRAVPLLRHLADDAILDLARAAWEERFEPGSQVIRAGDDDGRKFYIIRHGAADVELPSEDAGSEVVAGLTQHDAFGELALLTHAPRHASIRAAGRRALVVLAFDTTTFQGIIAEQVLLYRLVRAQRLAATPHRLDIREMGIFSDLPMRELGALLRDAGHDTWESGTNIITQGEAGDRFHIVLDGMVSVIRDGQEIASLGRGEFFGETALLYNCPRTATVRAQRVTHTWSIGRETFHRLMRHYLLDNQRMRDTIASRLQRGA
jgi:cAMP-dependent protein kinase regulator